MNNSEQLDYMLTQAAKTLIPSDLYDYGTALYDATREYVSDYQRHDAGLIAVGSGAVVQFAADMFMALGSDAGLPVVELKDLINERFEKEL